MIVELINKLHKLKDEVKVSKTIEKNLNLIMKE